MNAAATALAAAMLAVGSIGVALVIARRSSRLAAAWIELEARNRRLEFRLDESEQALERAHRLRVELERAMHERGAALERSEQDLALFANVASHDLQEPLRMVSSYAELLAARYRMRLDPDADAIISEVVDGARRMHALVNGLLVYTRVGSQACIEPADAGRALDE